MWVLLLATTNDAARFRQRPPKTFLFSRYGMTAVVQSREKDIFMQFQSALATGIR
jgi:hypothetical protein